MHYQLFKSDDPDAVPLIFRCVSIAGSVPSGPLTTPTLAMDGLVCVRGERARVQADEARPPNLSLAPTVVL